MTTMPTGQNEERVTSENGGSKSGSELSRLRNKVIELENYLKKQVANYRHTLPTKKCHSLFVLTYYTAIGVTPPYSCVHCGDE